MRTAQARLASGDVTTVRLNSTDNAVSFDTDALVVGVHTGPDGPRPAPGAESVDEALGGGLAATLLAMGVKGKQGEIAKLPTFGALSAPLLAVVGLGDAPEGDYDTESLRRAAGIASRALAGTSPETRNRG